MRTRTQYSFRKAYGFLEDVMDKVETDFAAITDTASSYGFNNWRKLCEKRGKKPIFGIEIAITPNLQAKRMNLNYVTLIATTELTPVNKALELAFSQFRYEPVLSYAQLNQIDESVAVILGRRIDPELLDESRQWYLADSPSTPRFMYDQADQRGWITIASSDNRYPDPDDQFAYELLLNRDASDQTWPQHILTEDELAAYCRPESIDNRQRLADICVAEMPISTLVTPDRSVPMEQWCIEGAKKLGIDLEDPIYAARLKRETEVVQKLGFEDYFLLIADLIRYARDHMYVGPARGSSAGSLICFLMEITNVDPIEHDLLFERFLDESRADLPDIDIDFADEDRDKVFSYLSDKYGAAHVARLGTISYLRERAFAKEIGMGLRIPLFEFEKVLQLVEAHEGNQSLSDVFKNTQVGQQFLAKYPSAAIADRLEGHARHHSTHSAGVAVTSRKICEHVAVDARNNTAEIDKHDAEDLGVLKIDALGLKQLSVFQDCLRLIGKSHEWLRNQPLDDPAAFQVLNDKLFSGVFQYNGSAVQGVSSSFVVETFEDMVATTALARPGPLGAGGTDIWLKIRRGEREVHIPHEAFEPIVGDTKGMILYQEQVMAAGRIIGGMDGPRTTKLRKAVQYFGGAAGMEEFRDEFMEGARIKGIPDQQATKFWDDLITFGQYCFNKSHAVAYSIISYHCCFLKAHWPQEYAAAMLNHEKDPSRQREMLRELHEENIDYLPVDPETSGLKWQVTKNGLVGPLTNVKGLGAKSAERYLEAKRLGIAPPKAAENLLKDPKTPLDSLQPISARIKENHPDLEAINIFSEPVPVDSLGTSARRGVLMFLRTLKATPREDEKNGGTKMTMVMEDDTGQIKVFLNNRKYATYGKTIMDTGRIGRTLWAVKGTIPEGGGIIFLDMIRYLGPFNE